MSSTAPGSNPSGSRKGATAAGEEKKGGKGKLIALIIGVVLLLLLLALLLSRCGSDDDSTTGTAAATTTESETTSAAPSTPSPSPTATPSPTEDTTTVPPVGPVAGDPGTVISADGSSVLDLAAAADPAGALAAVSGQTVTATTAQVLSVPADEGFWIGTSTDARVWVALTGVGETPYEVEAGDTVSFTGVVAPHDPGFAASVGLTDPADIAQLDAQGQHLDVAKDVLVLSAT